MKSFDFFIQKQEVKKITRDVELAKSLLEEVKTRIEIAFEMELNEKKARVVFELFYDSIRELIDVILALDGFKSYSHEANISYLRNFKEFNEAEILELDRFRVIRNGSKYYGKPAQLDDALKIKDIFPNLKERLMKIINGRMGGLNY